MKKSQLDELKDLYKELGRPFHVDNEENYLAAIGEEPAESLLRELRSRLEFIKDISDES